ncbi:MAG: flagellar basal body P-ring formation protein FlgA [Phycisphaerae bacterium]|nr:flagellar basal body P-ring formation protein FlgA [Phycisphaerae bacterium]
MMNWQRHGCLFVAFLVFAVTGAREESARAGEIRIWPTAVVTGEVVTLADVGDLRGFDPPTRHRLGQIVVHPAPRAGSQVLVRTADVCEALAKADANLASIRVFGSARCKVSKPRPPREPDAPGTHQPVAKPQQERILKQTPTSRARQKATGPAKRKAANEAGPTAPGQAKQAAAKSVEAKPATQDQEETLESILRQYIVARMPGRDAKLEIRFSPASEHLLRLSKAEHRFGIRPANERRLGFLSFNVDIMRADEPVRTEPLVVEVQLVREVVVARRPINRGQAIAGRDLQLEERRFTDLESIGITDLTAAVGQQCGRFVQRGEMLEAKMLKPVPLVRRGERVTVWARLGGVEIKTTGKAQGAGALGETVEVRRDGARRKQDLIEAVVTGPKTVAVADARQVASR